MLHNWSWKLCMSLLIGSAWFTAPSISQAQYPTTHLVWLVGDWEHRDRNSGMYEYLRTQLTQVFQHDGCINDGADTLQIREFWYNPLQELVTPRESGPAELEEFCTEFSQTIAAMGNNEYTVSIVGLGTGAVLAKNAFAREGGVGGLCELPNIDTMQMRINYFWIDQPDGFNDQPTIFYPDDRWDPYRGLTAQSSEMQTLRRSLRIYGNSMCRNHGTNYNELGCGYEVHFASSYGLYNPFYTYAPPSIGTGFGNQSRSRLRKDILNHVNLSWYSDVGNWFLAPSCRCPSPGNVSYWNSHHMLICWCDGDIDYIGGRPVCRPFQSGIDWSIDPDLLRSGRFLESDAWTPDDPPPFLTECGDGDPDPGEECDDGNIVNNDGCSSGCVKEFCGDKKIQDGIGEECDDGNQKNDDGCSKDCKKERCGDGVVQKKLKEACDDGNTTSGDGCSATCQKEVCGDGIMQVDLGEMCDGRQTSCPPRIFTGCLGGWATLTGCSKTCECEYQCSAVEVEDL